MHMQKMATESFWGGTDKAAYKFRKMSIILDGARRPAVVLAIAIH